MNGDMHLKFGLSKGRVGYYADSLGVLYFWLNRAILDKTPRGGIGEGILLNFHGGVTVEGKFGRRATDGVFRQCVSDPLDAKSREPSLVSRILGCRSEKAKILVAACSAAVVREKIEHPSDDAQPPHPDIMEFVSSGYQQRARDPRHFEQLYFDRLRKLAFHIQKREYGTTRLHVLRSDADLPMTAVYLEFSKPIVDGSSQGPIRRLLATALYDTHHATDVQLSDKAIDLEVPVHIILGRSESKETPLMIANLVKTYKNRIKSSVELPESIGRIFVSHRMEPVGEAERGTALIARLQETYGAAGYDVCHGNDNRAGTNIFARVRGLANRSDYAVILFPQGGSPFSNVPFELGYCMARLGPRRTIVVGDEEEIRHFLSNIAGQIVLDPHAAPGTTAQEYANKVFELLVELALPPLQDSAP